MTRPQIGAAIAAAPLLAPVLFLALAGLPPALNAAAVLVGYGYGRFTDWRLGRAPRPVSRVAYTHHATQQGAVA